VQQSQVTAGEAMLKLITSFQTLISKSISKYIIKNFVYPEDPEAPPKILKHLIRLKKLEERYGRIKYDDYDENF
jgi:hypothetical protein